MANRVLRDYTSSEKIDMVSSDAECLFIRLMTQADDFGSFHANAKLVKSACFPLKNWSYDKVEKLINELVKVRLIILYSADGKKYLHILDFQQRLRNMKNKFPQITDEQLNINNINNSPPSAASRRESPPETKRNEVETESEVESENEEPAAQLGFEFSDFISLFNEITGKKCLGDEKAKRHFAARKKQGRQPLEFQLAIAAAFADPFHIEKGYQYLTPEYITREDQFDKWLNVKRKEAKPALVTKHQQGFTDVHARNQQIQREIEQEQNGSSTQDGRLAS